MKIEKNWKDYRRKKGGRGKGDLGRGLLFNVEAHVGGRALSIIIDGFSIFSRHVVHVDILHWSRRGGGFLVEGRDGDGRILSLELRRPLLRKVLRHKGDRDLN